MMLIRDSCKARIGVGIISKHIEPCADWKLRDNYSLFSNISGVKYFKEFPAFEDTRGLIPLKFQMERIIRIDVHITSIVVAKILVKIENTGYNIGKEF